MIRSLLKRLAARHNRENKLKEEVRYLREELHHAQVRADQTSAAWRRLLEDYERLQQKCQ